MLSRRSLAVWATVAFLYVLVSCILCAQGALELAPDSVRYLPPVDVWSPQQPGVLTALMFQLVGGGGSNVKVLLTTTSVVSWLGLSFVTFLNFKGSVTGFLLATSVLGYSLLPFISGWRFLALSEDVSISTTVMWVACMLVIPLCSTRRCLGVALVVAAVAGLLAVATRPQMALVVLPTQITVLVLARRRAHLVPIGLVLAMTVFSAAFAWIRLDQLQHLKLLIAAVDQITDEHRRAFRVPVDPRLVTPVSELPQQRQQLGRTAVNIADDVVVVQWPPLLSDRDDNDDLLEADEVVGIAGVERHASGQSRRRYEEIGHAAPGLATSGQDCGGAGRQFSHRDRADGCLSGQSIRCNDVKIDDHRGVEQAAWGLSHAERHLDRRAGPPLLLRSSLWVISLLTPRNVARVRQLWDSKFGKPVEKLHQCWLLRPTLGARLT